MTAQERVVILTLKAVIPTLKAVIPTLQAVILTLKAVILSGAKNPRIPLGAAMRPVPRAVL